MKPTTDIVEELRLYNRWRRGDEAITAPDPTALGKLLDDAADRIEHLFASGIHTCHADCQRPMCVLRRERDKAHADLARVTAERDNARAQALADRAFQSDNAALRARNAELESSCRDLRVAYEQNASQCVRLNRELALKSDTVEWLNGVTIQRQRAEQAERRNAELVAALEELYETANRFPTFDGSRLASALDSASAALARNRAAQEASK